MTDSTRLSISAISTEWCYNDTKYNITETSVTPGNEVNEAIPGEKKYQ